MTRISLFSAVLFVLFGCTDGEPDTKKGLVPTTGDAKSPTADSNASDGPKDGGPTLVAVDTAGGVDAKAEVGIPDAQAPLDADTALADPGSPADPGPDPKPDTSNPTDAPDTDESPPPKQPWTLVVLPDTQYYSYSFPWVFEKQTQWIADHYEDLGLGFVVHEGDITDQNTDAEWVSARAAIDILVEADVPFALVPGNHDYEGNAKSRSTLMNAYFDMEDYVASWEVGAFEAGQMQNTWHAFPMGSESYLVLALEFGPRDEVVEWAADVLASHPDHRVILVTHAFTYYDDSRYHWWEKGGEQSWNPHSYGMASAPGGVNDGEELWQKLVASHPNVILTLNGHVLGDGNGRVVSKGNYGNIVHQVLVNFQTGVTPAQPDGGGGFLRLMTFMPDDTIEVKTYSPLLDEWLTDSENEFALTFDPSDYDYLNDCSPGRVSTCECEDGGPGVMQCDEYGEFATCTCVGDGSFPYIEIEDDPENATLVPCDPGPITSPGADIDAALLKDGAGETIATLTGCVLVEGTSCDNDNAEAKEAHGDPDAPGSEAGGNYVSLNGGKLTCQWTGGAAAAFDEDMSIVVHEIGGSVEQYRFRLCKSPGGECLAVTGYGSGIQSVPVDSFL